MKGKPVTTETTPSPKPIRKLPAEQPDVNYEVFITDAAERRAHKPLDKAKVKRVVAAVKRQAAVDVGQRPYTLESGNLAADLARQRDAALSEIEAIDASVLDITLRAARDKEAIQARADTEIEGRRQRSADLQRIVDMAKRALTEPKPPTEAAPGEMFTANASVINGDIAVAIEAQRQYDAELNAARRELNQI